MSDRALAAFLAHARRWPEPKPGEVPDYALSAEDRARWAAVLGPGGSKPSRRSFRRSSRPPWWPRVAGVAVGAAAMQWIGAGAGAGDRTER